MKNSYLILSILGLILDFIGFVGIYFTKLNKVNNIRTSSFGYLNRLKSNKPTSEAILESVNRKIDEINSNYIKQDRKTLKFFLIVSIGVFLQIISTIIALFCPTQF